MKLGISHELIFPPTSVGLCQICHSAMSKVQDLARRVSNSLNGRVFGGPPPPPKGWAPKTTSVIRSPQPRRPQTSSPKVEPSQTCLVSREADRGVVLAAVRAQGRALRFAAPELRRDPEAKREGDGGGWKALVADSLLKRNIKRRLQQTNVEGSLIFEKCPAGVAVLPWGKLSENM